jgi:hypothetical protein
VLTQEQQTKKDFEKDLAQWESCMRTAHLWVGKSNRLRPAKAKDSGQQGPCNSPVFDNCRYQQPGGGATAFGGFNGSKGFIPRGIYRKIAFAKMFTSNYYIYFIVYIYIYVENISICIYIHTFICTWVTST